MTEFNPVMSAAVAASWTVPEVAAARSKRYAATVQKTPGGPLEMFPSVPAALRALGVFVGQRSIRAAARDCEQVNLEVDGKIVVLAALEISQ
jgi:hypothetical protein